MHDASFRAYRVCLKHISVLTVYKRSKGNVGNEWVIEVFGVPVRWQVAGGRWQMAVGSSIGSSIGGWQLAWGENLICLRGIEGFESG